VVAGFAAFCGFFFGGYQSHKSQQQRQREEVLNKLKQQLQTLASQVLRYAINHFDELGLNYERKISEFFQQSIDDARKRLEEQSEQAKRAMSQTKEENAKSLEDIRRRNANVETILKRIKTVL
jgi:DNA anti-recombination protein RmuC